MIRKTEKFDVEYAKKRVVTFLSELMVLTSDEKLFLKQFSKGIYEPKLLFVDKDIIARIENHSMARWRTQKTV